MTSKRHTTVDVTREDFERARAHVAPHVHHTPLVTSRLLNEGTGFNVYGPRPIAPH